MRRACLIFSLACIFCFITVSLLAQAKHRVRNVEPIDVKGVEQLIHKREGRILFLNVWATWCKPCVEEFPDLVKLDSAYPDSVVDIVAVSVDYPDEMESKILPFLDRYGVSFKVYVADVKKQEDFINALNPAWSGAVPATFIFDAYGKRRAFLLGQKDFKIFKTEIDKVLSD